MPAQNKLIHGHYVQDDGTIGCRGVLIVTADSRDAETGYRLSWRMERATPDISVPIVTSAGGVWKFCADTAAACERALGSAEGCGDAQAV